MSLIKQEGLGPSTSDQVGELFATMKALLQTQRSALIYFVFAVSLSFDGDFIL